MRNRTFVVWSAMMGVGVALSQCVYVPYTVLLAAFLSSVLTLCALHSVRCHDAFFLVTCFFFVVLGVARGLQGDVAILPQWLHGSASAVRKLVSGRLHSLGAPYEVVSLLDAMLLGHRSVLSPETRRLYYDAGASHLLALSGLHLTILFGVFHYCFMRVLTYAPFRYASGLTGILLLWGYALLTGFPVSLVRASVMMSLFIISQMRLCGADGWHTLGVAAMLILLVSPSSLWSVGFQLSFASMLGLLTFYAPVRSLVSVGGVLGWLWSAVAVSFSAQILGFPLVVYYFHQISLYSVFLSPFYIILVTLILCFALLALVLGKFAMVAVTVFAFILHTLMRYASLLPCAMIRNLYVSPAQVVLQYMATVCLIPVLYALSPQGTDIRGQRLSRFFRRWPYIVAGVMCLLFSYIIN